jgi:ABC-type uncharacterized transport system permease subunit
MSLPAAGNPSVDPFAAGESSVRRQMAAAAGRIKRLKRIDRLAVGVITFGGIAVVVSVIGILVFIGAEAIPLFRGAATSLAGTLRVGQGPARRMDRQALGSDEFGRYVYTLDPSGTILFFHRDTGARELEVTPPLLVGANIVASSRSLMGDFLAASTAGGRVALLQVRFLPDHQDGAAAGVRVDVRERGTVALDARRQAAQRVSYI